MVLALAPRVSLLDGFALYLGGDALADPLDLPRAVQRLVATLGLSRRPARTAVAGQLWPDVSEDHAHGSLRSALWRLQKVAPGLVEVTGGTLCLAADVSVDVRELSDWAHRVADPRSEGTDVAVPADALRGELLPGWYDDWVLLERERLRQLRIHALEALADRLTRARRYGEAVQAAYAAVRAEPLRESARRALVRVYLAEGNVHEALRAYEDFRLVLDQELGLSPTPQMTALVAPFDRRCGVRPAGRVLPPPRRPVESSGRR